jgi:hypothetical protein
MWPRRARAPAPTMSSWPRLAAGPRPDGSGRADWAGGRGRTPRSAPDMRRPAEGESNCAVLSLLLLPGQHFEPGMAVDLQHSGEGGEVALWMRALAVLAVDTGDRRRERTLPPPVVAGIDHSRPVLVRPRPGSSTVNRVLSARSRGRRRIEPRNSSASGRNHQQARPTQLANVERSRSMP